MKLKILNIATILSVTVTNDITMATVYCGNDVCWYSVNKFFLKKMLKKVAAINIIRL